MFYAVSANLSFRFRVRERLFFSSTSKFQITQKSLDKCLIELQWNSKQRFVQNILRKRLREHDFNFLYTYLLAKIVLLNQSLFFSYFRVRLVIVMNRLEFWTKYFEQSKECKQNWMVLETFETERKIKCSVRNFCSKCGQFSRKLKICSASLFTFTKEILNGKLHFLCCMISVSLKLRLR